MASVAVNQFVRTDKTFDFDKLKSVVKVVTKNLNKVRLTRLSVDFALF